MSGQGESADLVDILVSRGLASDLGVKLER